MEQLVFDVAFAVDIDMSMVIMGLALLFISVVVIVVLWNGDHKRMVFAFVLFQLGTGLLVFARIPQHFVVDTHALTIERPGPDVEIPLRDIVSVARIGNDKLEGIRREGVVTDLGVIKVGVFRNNALGRFHAYMTSDRNLVFLKTASQAYLLSPDRPEDFMYALSSTENN